MGTPHTCLSVSGSRGTGKSTLVHLLAQERSVRRVLVLDPLGDWKESSPDKDDGFVEHVAVTTADVARYLDDSYIIDNKSDEFSIAMVPETSEEFAAIYLSGWAKHLRNCTLILEEAHGACAHPCSEELMQFAKRGRHYNCGLWTVSQRPSDIDPNLRAELNASESWYLRLVEKVDLDVVKSRRGSDFADLVADAPNFTAFRIQPGTRGWDEYHVTPNRLHFVRHEGEAYG